MGINFRDGLFCWILGLVAAMSLSGCAQMSASYTLGYEHHRFEGRVLKYGTDDFARYVMLEKQAHPKWYGFISEHGEPDYVVPVSGSRCKMVWIGENITAELTFLGSVTTSDGIPDEVRSMIVHGTPAERNRLARVKLEAEEAVKRDAQNAYLESLKKGTRTGDCRFRVDRLEYVDATKRGTLAITVGDNDFTAARIWARSYIEALVLDKNVALVTGEKNSEGRYLLTDEQVKDGTYIVQFEAL